MEQLLVAVTTEQPQYPENQVDVPQHQEEESLTLVVESCELSEKQWQCDRCGKIFKSADAIKGHIEVVHNGVKYTCEICGATMKWKNNLNIHMRKMHNVGDPPLKKIKNRQCERCSSIFTTNKLLAHHILTVHKEDPFKCEICGETFSIGTTWSTHKLKHQELVMYTCSVCGLRYRTKFSFQMHVKKTGHQEQTQEKVTESTKKDQGLEKVGRSIKSDSKKTEHEMVCPKCNKQFDYYQSFRAHVNNACVGVKRDWRPRGKIRHHLGDRQCKCCTEVFDTVRELKDHVHSVHAVKVQENARYTYKYPCPVCKKIVTYSGLTYHQQKHAGMTNYSCDQCDYKCILKTDLVKHQTKHTGEKQFKCRFCSRQFDKKNFLVDHENKLHLQIGVKPYQCNVCQRKFDDDDYRSKHQKKCKRGVPHYEKTTTTSKSHIGFRCMLCSAVFGAQSGLTRHRKTRHVPTEKTSNKLNSKQSPVVKETDGIKEKQPEYHPSCPFCSQIFNNLGVLIIHEDKCVKRKEAREKALGSKDSEKSNSSDNND